MIDQISCKSAIITIPYNNIRMETTSQTFNIFSDSDDQQEMLKNSQPLLTMQNTNIMDVFADNFQEELKKMAKLVTTFNCISMDTEFPGYTITPQANWAGQDEKEYEYQLIRSNVNNSKIIQIGLTLSDEHGRVPQGICTWQFNFHFLMGFDAMNGHSKQLLLEAGIDFIRLKDKGINVKDFAQYWVASGIPLNKKVKWIVFHGSYDFAYLLRIVHGDGLPTHSSDFYRLMKIYYPNIYDLKYYIKDLPILKDVGLNKLATQFGCSRIGPQHQAGSDSLLTLRCYFKLKQRQHVLKNTNYLNIIYGIGDGYIKTNSSSSNNVQTYPNYGGRMIQEQHNYMPSNMYYYNPHPHQLYYYYQPYGYN